MIQALLNSKLFYCFVHMSKFWHFTHFDHFVRKPIGGNFNGRNFPPVRLPKGHNGVRRVVFEKPALQLIHGCFAAFLQKRGNWQNFACLSFFCLHIVLFSDWWLITWKWQRYHTKNDLMRCFNLEKNVGCLRTALNLIFVCPEFFVQFLIISFWARRTFRMICAFEWPLSKNTQVDSDLSYTK